MVGLGLKLVELATQEGISAQLASGSMRFSGCSATSAAPDIGVGAQRRSSPVRLSAITCRHGCLPCDPKWNGELGISISSPRRAGTKEAPPSFPRLFTMKDPSMRGGVRAGHRWRGFVRGARDRPNSAPGGLVKDEALAAGVTDPTLVGRPAGPYARRNALAPAGHGPPD